MKWLSKLREGKKEQIAILLLAGLLLVVIALPSESPQSSPAGQTETEETVSAQTAQDQASLLEDKLKRMLSRVEGVGRADVMITLKSDGQQLVEKDLELQNASSQSPDKEGEPGGQTVQSSNSENTVYQKDAYGNETPYVRETLSPEIEGVLVIAQGGGNAVVAGEITEAVMALFGIQAHKIKVMKME